MRTTTVLDDVYVYVSKISRPSRCDGNILLFYVSIAEIIKLVRDGPGILDAPFRPKVDESSYEDVNNIMIKCWSEEPTDRPDFSGLKTIIRKINK